MKISTLITRVFQPSLNMDSTEQATDVKSSEALSTQDKALQCSKLILSAENKGFKEVKLENHKIVEGQPGKVQIKAVLTDGEITTPVRMKPCRTINEALQYYRIQSENDPMKNHIPESIGYLDKDGKQINFEEILAKEKFPLSADLHKELNEKYSPIYCILKDVVKEVESEGGTPESPKDFKFAKPALVGSNEEAKAHGNKIRGSLYNFIRQAFFACSDCSFAYQSASTSQGGVFTWFINLFKRVGSVSKTKSEIKSMFAQMSQEQIKKTIQETKKLKEDFKDSDFAFVDASILFVPYKKNEEMHLKIILIDLAYTMHKDENIEGFAKVRQQTEEALDDLLSIANESLEPIKKHQIIHP